MTTTDQVTAASLGTHAFLRDMCGEHLALLAETATIISVPVRHRLLEEGGYAKAFWLIRTGQVTLDVRIPGGRVIVDTLGRGDVLGWSWMFPPHEWQFGAMTIQPVEAFELNGAAVRARCDEHPDLGHELTLRFSRVLAHRLRATRLRLARQYPHPEGAWR
jgi:CRP/FNR family transcriptional regulator, cyclic AMP receptor protein